MSERIGKGNGVKSKIIIFNGKEEWSEGNNIVNVEINGKSKRLEVIVKKKLLENADILGLNIIEYFGGIRIENGRVEFLVDAERRNEEKEKVKRKYVNLINKKRIDDIGFEGNFDGEKWIIKWKWKSEMEKTNIIKK